MSEDSTSAGLVELVRRLVEASNRRDFDAVESFYAADVVLRGAQIGTFKGPAAAPGAGLIEQQTNYTDIDEARAAAEHLAEERG